MLRAMAVVYMVASAAESDAFTLCPHAKIRCFSFSPDHLPSPSVAIWSAEHVVHSIFMQELLVIPLCIPSLLLSVAQVVNYATVFSPESQESLPSWRILQARACAEGHHRKFVADA